MKFSNSESAALEIEIARYFIKQGRERDALQRLTTLIQDQTLTGNRLARVLLERGRLWYFEGHLDNAIEDLMWVTESKDVSAAWRGSAFVALADCYEEAGDPTAVIEALQQAIRLRAIRETAATATLHNFGVRCNLRSRPDAAFLYFNAVCQKGWEASPGVFCNSVINRGCYLGELGHYGLAEDDFRRALAHPFLPREYFARAHYNLGHMHWILGQYDEAIEEFSTAIDCPEISETLRLLALCKSARSHQRMGREDRAMKLLDELLPIPRVESTDDYETLLFNTGIILLAARRHNEAEEYFVRTAAIHGVSTIMKARSLWSLGYSQSLRTNSSLGVPLMREARAAFVELNEPEFVELIDEDLSRFADPGS